jgi:hypothetical protein
MLTQTWPSAADCRVLQASFQLIHVHVSNVAQKANDSISRVGVRLHNTLGVRGHLRFMSRALNGLNWPPLAITAVKGGAWPGTVSRVDISPVYNRIRQLNTSLNLKDTNLINNEINRVDQMAGGGNTVCDRTLS